MIAFAVSFLVGVPLFALAARLARRAPRLPREPVLFRNEDIATELRRRP
jgi:hypothetical protein